MSKTTWMAACVVAAAVMAAISAVSFFMGGCPGMLELTSGNSVPMKCHWTFIADAFVGIIGIVMALVAISCKEQSGRRAAAIGYIATALVAACMPASFAIGLCANPDMHCHTTATIVWVACAVAVIVGIVLAAKANPSAADLPKRSL